MKLGREIKQSSFTSHTEEALINLLYTNNKILSQLNSIYKTKGIQSQHFNVLRIIKGKHPEAVNPGQIKEVMLDKGRDLTRLLDKLERAGYIQRKVNDQNRRLMDINISEEGINVTNELSEKVSHWMKNQLTITEAEAAKLSDLLDKFRG